MARNQSSAEQYAQELGKGVAGKEKRPGRRVPKEERMGVSKSADQGKKDGALFTSLGLLDAAGVAKALKAGADPNAKFVCGSTEEPIPALSVAFLVARDAIYGNMEELSACERMCRLLVEAGADVDEMAGVTWKCAPLHRACLYGSREIARMLLDAGADPNARSLPGGCPPLKYALSLASTRKILAMSAIALDLAHAGADPGLVDNDGERADNLAQEDLRSQLASIAERKALEAGQLEAKKSRASPSL